MSQTISLESFATLVDAPGETVRTLLKRDLAPIPRNPKPQHGGRGRSYDAEDVAAWVAFEALRDAGLAPRPAARAVRQSGVGAAFAHALEHNPPAAHAMCLLLRRIRDPLSDRVLDLVEVGEAATARRYMAAGAIDRALPDREQLLGLTVIPLMAHWQAAVQRAAGLPIPWSQLGLPEPGAATDV